MADMTVRVSNGKYTFVKIAATTSIKVLRHGEPWHEQEDAFNALASVMCELDAARVVVCAARRLIEQVTQNNLPMPSDLRRAVDLHGRLVDDTEQPSEWCGPSHAEPF